MSRAEDGVHDGLTKIIQQECIARGWPGGKMNMEYSSPRGNGEIDYHTEKNGYRIVFETKSHLNYKAWERGCSQIKRMSSNYFTDNKRTFYFIVHYNSKDHNDYTLHRIRHPKGRNPFWEAIQYVKTKYRKKQ